jgi:hypothetical protein
MRRQSVGHSSECRGAGEGGARIGITGGRICSWNLRLVGHERIIAGEMRDLYARSVAILIFWLSEEEKKVEKPSK